MPCAHGRPVLVTGAHRSGSTWVGKMLASHPRAGYVHEPFNAEAEPECPVRHLWHHVTEQDEMAFLAYLRRRFRYPHSWWRDFAAYPGPRRVVGTTLRSLHALALRLRRARPVMKDPIAFFSAEWLARAFNMDVVVMIRHPAAFAASLKRLNWAFPFRFLLEQPRLMEAHLAPFEGAMRRLCETPADLIDHAILSWRIIYATALRYRARHPEWVFVRHEDLSLDPVAGFRKLFARVGLDFPARSRRSVEVYSGPGNAADAPAGASHFLPRDSRASVSSWVRRLTAGEVDRVRRGTEDCAGYFYPEFTWWPASGRRAA